MNGVNPASPHKCPYAEISKKRLNEEPTEESSSKRQKQEETIGITGELFEAYRPVYSHAASFANPDGVLTDKSILERQKQLKDKGNIADLRRRAVLSAGGNTPTVKNICSFKNEARSGIWNTDGTLNVERLKELKKLCIEKDGNLLISRSIFQKFIDERRASINKTYFTPDFLAFGNLTWTPATASCPYPKIPVPFTAVTDGSIDAFFQAYSEDNVNSEKVVTWKKICDFYDPQNTSNLREE